MSNTGSRAGSSDALSSLLTDLPGVEGNIFSRPKTLGGMKKVQQTPVKAQLSLNASPKPPSDAPFPTSGRPPSYPSPAKQGYESAPSESHSIADLENMLQGSTPHNAATTNEISPQGQQQSLATATPPYDDPFADFVSSPPIVAQPTGPVSTPSPAAQSNFGGMSSVPIDEDPLHMFGGTPIPSSSSLHSHMNVTATNSNRNNDFFADFGEAPAPSNAAAAAGQHPSSHASPSYSEIDLSSPSPPSPVLPTQLSSSPPLRTSSTTSSTTSSSFKDRISEKPVATKTSHKAFQFLDAKQAAAPPVSQMGRKNSHLDGSSGDVGGTSFDADYQQQQQSTQGPGHSGTQHPTTEGVVELGHRAAKVLQAGTKWFMKASKQIATEVQSKIEKHRGGQQQFHHSSDHATGDSGHMTTSHSFYFDWASQIARMSPGTRAAAMGAMQEEDRLQVQQIIDEAELGEVVLNTIQGENSISGGGGPLEQGRSNAVFEDDFKKEKGHLNQMHRDVDASEQEQKAMPPPPSYDELMGSAAAGTTGGRSTRPIAFSFSSSPVVAPAVTVVEHNEEKDLLGGMIAKKAESVVVADTGAVEDDLLRMDGENISDTVNTTNGTGHIDDLFTVPKPVPTVTRPRSSGATVATGTTATAAATGKGSSNAGGLSSMIDLADSLPDVDTTGYSELYVEKESGAGVNGIGGGEDPNEPEIRKVLRQKRIAEKHERMMRQLAEKRAREEVEDAEKSGKVAFRDTLKPKIDAWSGNKKDNIRALLSTVHTVLWEDSGWTAPSIADMVEPSKVKKWYMKANLVVHPDKVKQKGGTLEQVATADMVFDVLKAAWGKFDASK